MSDLVALDSHSLHPLYLFFLKKIDLLIAKITEGGRIKMSDLMLNQCRPPRKI